MALLLGLERLGPRQVGKTSAQLRNHLGHDAAEAPKVFAEGIGVALGGAGADGIGKWPERARGFALGAAAPEHLDLRRAGPGGELLQEPRLPDPRLADEEGQSSRAVP